MKIKRKTHTTSKKHLEPLIALIALIVILSLGFKHQLSPTSPTPSVVPNPMADWKIYQNLKYNFSFKYPASFGGQGSISGPVTGTVESFRSFTDPKTIHSGTSDYFDGFSVYIVTKPGTTDLNKYINKEIVAMNVAKFTGMKNPTKVELTSGVVLISQNEKQAYYYLPTPDKKMIVVFAYLQSDPLFKQTFDQVLSTFRFTN